MGRKRHKKKAKQGLAPGSLIFTGVQKMEEVEYTVMEYDEHQVIEHNPKSIVEINSLIDTSSKTLWINIDGIHDESVIETLGSKLNVHKLSLEDILSVGQRPKIDEFEDYLHIIVKMVMLDQQDEIEDEQLSFILHKNILISFQEKSGDVFHGVRKRIIEGKGFIRKRGSDYLLYALIDSVVDHYFLILEAVGEKIETLETELLLNPEESVLAKLHHLRRETLELRRSVYPLREVISRFEKIDESFLNPDVRVFIRDLYDHTIQVIETIEVLRESASGLLDLYMNSVSNKMNEIMKVLTIMASIFIPLTFIAGVYGMNFDNMPELHYKYGYHIIWAVMVLVFLGLLIYFKRKKWL
ncbi:magnesium/cobalt transporter CorA [uncultured Planktosalinus sp.]|mgnify:CR=1 FL=1|uniref:magnesium/cobalt transporter CorA n=1 Tax=uncultured Planktosalinus sp. TaxID=1810935 RepID=UPI0030D7D7F2